MRKPFVITLTAACLMLTACSLTNQPSAGADVKTADQLSRTVAHMTLAEKVGQLIMMGSPSTKLPAQTRQLLATQYVGSIILTGNSYLSVADMRQLTDRLQSHAVGPGLFIATDQEGGLVQRLRGSGFTRIPSAVVQGTLAPYILRERTAHWAKQLKAAGISLDLAPVLDTVPPGNAPNPPIGDLDREYGRTPAAVTSHGLAVVRGMHDAFLPTAVKHFPGLGRVRGNTDTTAGVRDTVTVRDDAYMAPFAAAVRNHTEFVMMSTAIYTRIDGARPAAFSHTVVTGILRHDLDFTGVVISDDVGTAKQVQYLTPGQRAVHFVMAGGDMVLTVDASLVPAMTAALMHRAETHPAFLSKVNASVRRILLAKQHAGLA